MANDPNPTPHILFYFFTFFLSLILRSNVILQPICNSNLLLNSVRRFTQAGDLPLIPYVFQLSSMHPPHKLDVSGPAHAGSVKNLDLFHLHPYGSLSFITATATATCLLQYLCPKRSRMDRLINRFYRICMPWTIIVHIYHSMV